MNFIMYIIKPLFKCTPSFMKNFCPELLRKTILSATSSLRILELGGEPCPSRSCLYSWKDSHNRTQFYNVYGLTEVSCWATIHFINFDNIEYVSYLPYFYVIYNGFDFICNKCII